MADEGYRGASIQERVDLFLDIHQTLADQLGIAVPVQHGETMKLYDIWNQELVEVELHKGTEIKKENGEVIITEFDRREI